MVYQPYLSRMTIRLLLMFLALLHFRAAPPPWQELQGKVVAIADGDTFTLLDAQNRQHKVRLYGVDAPEKGQDWSKLSKEALRKKVFGKKVMLRWKSKDRWKRIIAWVYTADSACVNEALLSDGAAWHFTEYDQNPAWALLETNARKQKRGLWSQPAPLAPWLWRKAKRKR